MAELNGLGYWQTAAGLSEGRANRSSSRWQQVLDLWAKRLDTMQSQDWTLNKQMPAAQGYAKEIQGMQDTSAMDRQGVSDESALQRLMLELSGKSSENALDRTARAGEFKASLAADNKPAEPPDFWTSLLVSAKGSGGQGIDPSGFLDNSLVTDPTALRNNFALTVNNDPAMMKKFDTWLATKSSAANAPTKDEPTQQDLEKAHPILGAFSKGFASFSDTLKQLVALIPNVYWMKWLGKLDPKGYATFTAALGAPQFGVGSAPSAPPAANVPRPPTAGGRY